MPLPWERYPNVISLGAGVQSSTMALMASEGLITPMPRFAIFADTQDEPKAVYDWLDLLEPHLSFPVVRVSKGSLSVASLKVRVSKNSVSYTDHSIPAYTANEDGTPSGLLMRQCTEGFKLRPLFSYMKRRFRYGSVCQWIGISTDEAGRIKQSRETRIHNRHPLIELNMSRDDCKEWMRSRGYSEAPRSACKQCPYRGDDEWLSLTPEEFQDACTYETSLQATMAAIPSFTGTVFLHSSLVPLSEVKFKPGAHRMKFVNECEGMCGV